MATPAALKSYIDGLDARRAAGDAAAAAWQSDAFSAARRVSDLLVRDFSATRVVLFGSVSRQEARVGSDVDILVEGVTAAQWFAACAAASSVAGRVDVDLVPRDGCRPYILERALAEGVVLHG